MNAATHHFSELTRDEQDAAIKSLAADGLTDYDIATITQMAVEQVRRILGRHPPPAQDAQR